MLNSVSKDIWIIGSSIIRRAYEHTIQRPPGHHLGLDKKGFNVVWIGWSGMKWAMLETMVDKKGCPSVLLIHCGGNDNKLSRKALFH